MSLRFAFWPVRPDIVRTNLRQFTAETGIAVEAVEISGDYCENVWASQPDVLYAQRGEASLWMQQGLIQEIDGLPGAVDIVRQMYPAIQESSRTREGRLIGLTYYNAGPLCLFRNEQLVGSSKARTWQEVAREASATGSQILMRWFPGHNGLPWSMLAQAYSEGERFVDSEGRAVFGPGSPLAKVLEDWAGWCDRGLVPRECLDWSGERLTTEWATGKYAFFLNMDYEVTQYAEWTGVHPLMPGETHDTVLPGHAMLCLSREANVAEAWQLVRFLGYRNKRGELLTHKRWIEAMNLWVPFPELYERESVRQTMLQWLRADQFQSFIANRERSLAAPVTHARWFLKWSGVCEALIRNELLGPGGMNAGQVTTALRRSWENMRAGTD